MTLKLPLLLLITTAFLVVNSVAQVPLVFDVENTGASCTVSPGPLANNQNLPDPFSFTGGGRVSTFDEWKCRRNEIKADIEQYEIGPKPARPADITATYSGNTLTVTIRENGRTLTLTSQFSIPTGAGPHPIVIGMNSGTGSLAASLFNGVVQVPFNHDQVVTYANGSGSRNLSDPFFQFYPNLTHVGKYSAWSWGISRLIDGLELVAPSLNLDMERIAVTGCSYAGKMALFAGAFDERIALTIAQESGGGGINSWRLSQDFTNRTGTNIEKINNTNGSWFMQSMLSRDPYSLPHDHHELIAMIAPRAFLTLGNPGFEWLGDESGYKSVMAAMEVWKAMGVEDRFGFDFTGGHNHCQAASNQNTSVTAFVNKFLRNNTSANTTVRVVPSQTGFDLNYQTKINWTTPEISFNQNTPQITVTAPASNSRVLVSASVQIAAQVTDNDNNVSRVEFFVDDVKIGEDASAPYTFTWSSANPGDYTISAKATDAEANTATATAAISVVAPQGPYNGTAATIPGIIQLEEFDSGGQDSAYYDNTSGSEVTPVVNYRTDEDVDIESCQDAGGGYNIGWATAGEWIEYTVDVAETGLYNIDLRVACNGDGRTLDIDMDGQLIAGNVSIPNTAGWQAWQTVTVNNVPLSAGEQVMRITIGDVNYINLNYAEFELNSVTSTSAEEEIGLTVGPNPFDSEVKIAVQKGMIDYAVYNSSGQLVEDGQMQKEVVTGENLVPGIYLLEIRQGEQVYRKKIIKK